MRLDRKIKKKFQKNQDSNRPSQNDREGKRKFQRNDGDKRKFQKPGTGKQGRHEQRDRQKPYGKKKVFGGKVNKFKSANKGGRQGKGKSKGKSRK